MSLFDDMMASISGGPVGAMSPGAFPAPTPTEMEAVRAEDAAARWQEKQRKEQEAALAAAQARQGLTGVPPMAPVVPPLAGAAAQASSPSVQMALGNQPANVAPQPFSLAGGAPAPAPMSPSMQLAAQMSAPPPAAPGPAGPPGAVPPGAMQPQAPITGLNAPIGGVGPAGPPPPASPPPASNNVAGSPENPDTDNSSRGRIRGAPTLPMSIAGPAAAAPASSGGFSMDKLGDALLGFGGALQGDRGAMTEHILGQRQALAQQTEMQNMTAKALIAKGVDPATVAAAVRQPDLLKAIIQQNFGKSKYKLETVAKDEWGGEQKAFVNQEDPSDQLGIDGKPLRPGAEGAISGAPSAYLAKGVTAVNHDLVGDDYLKQFSPEMQAAVHAYHNGETAPTNNPRKGWAENVKKVALKYGNDVGDPINDATFNQRKTFATSLADQKSGVGLARKGFQQGLEHFTKLSDNLVNMKLSNGFGLESVARGVNSLKGMTTDQQELIHKSDVIGGALAREMGNLFSKSGGGVREAEETKKAVSNAYMSSKSAAGSLEAVDELMQGGLRTLENERDQLFPKGNAPRGAQFMGPQQKEALDHIRRNIAILKGERPETAAPAAGPAAAAAPIRVSSPKEAAALPRGTHFLDPHGVERVVP